jgi:hypothetical protein
VKTPPLRLFFLLFCLLLPAACGEGEKSFYEENLDAEKFFSPAVHNFLKKEENAGLFIRYKTVAAEIKTAAAALRQTRREKIPSPEEKARREASCEAKLIKLALEKVELTRDIADVYLGKKPPPPLPLPAGAAAPAAPQPWHSALAPYKRQIALGIIILSIVFIWRRARRCEKTSAPPRASAPHGDAPVSPRPPPFPAPPFSAPPKNNREMALFYAYHFQETAKRCRFEKSKTLDEFCRRRLQPLGVGEKDIALELVHDILRRFLAETSSNPVLPDEWNPSSLEKLKCFDPGSPLLSPAPAPAEK